LPANIYTHLTFVREGTGSNQVKFYVNGALHTSGTYAGGMASGGSVWIGGISWASTTTNHLTGYMSNVRLVKGTAVYTSNFTPSTTPLTAIANTSLLTCQSNRFVDNSTNAFTITRAGNVSVQAFSPFAPTAAYTTANVGGSAYFDGTGDYLGTVNTPANFGNGDFTAETWVWFNTNSVGYQPIMMNTGSGDYQGWVIITETSNIMWFIGSTNGSSWTHSINTNIIPTTNCWTHIALVRSGSTITIYINGVSAGTSNIGSSSLHTPSGAFYVGYYPFFPGGARAFNGYFSGTRLVNGRAIYTTNFTSPTAPPTNVANTSLLLNFTNAGITDATAKNVLETIGDAKISTAQSKFGGSSMLFDGSGDRLTIPFTSDLLELGIGGQKFTVEAWIYPTNTMASAGTLLSKGGGAASWSTTNGAQYQWGISSSALTWSFNSSGSSILVNNGTLTLNTWQHVAVTYDGTTTRTYLNGLLQSTSTSSYTAPSTRNLQYIGMTQSGGYTQEYYGYINDLRITKGIARYTSNFTAPTSAFKGR
jgi:hypothetical protein